MKPKAVYVTRFQDFAKIGRKPHLQDELDDIIESIERGDGVPEVHYRRRIDQDRDGMLEEKGVMHLHLGGKGSDTLVFLVQYVDRVVLLETNSHMHLRTRPAGKNILALSQSWFRALEQELETASAVATDPQSTSEAKSTADTDRLRLAASISTFKRFRGS